MGREVRRVPLDWEHPVNPDPNPYWRANEWDWTGQGRHFQPMRGRVVAEDWREWDEGKAQWDAGERPKYWSAGDTDDYEEWAGERPDPAYYRPDWPAESMVGYQLYETVTEGTPLSPVFEQPEDLARFLVDRLGYFSDVDSAMRFVAAGWAPSFISDSRGLRPGYEAVADAPALP